MTGLPPRRSASAVHGAVDALGRVMDDAFGAVPEMEDRDPEALIEVKEMLEGELGHMRLHLSRRFWREPRAEAGYQRRSGCAILARQSHPCQASYAHDVPDTLVLLALREGASPIMRALRADPDIVAGLMGSFSSFRARMEAAQLAIDLHCDIAAGSGSSGSKSI